MFRQAYALLVRLHPRGFRERYGEEMTWIFDETDGLRPRAWLLAEGAASLVRQRLLRDDVEPPNFRRTPGVPAFVLVGDEWPNARILAFGALATILAWSALNAVWGLGGGTPPTRHPRLPRAYFLADVSFPETIAAAWSDVLAFVGLSKAYVPPPPLTRKLLQAQPFLPATVTTVRLDLRAVMPPPNPARQDAVFNRIDRNLDGRLSREEIEHAPEHLGSLQPALSSPLFALLDADHDGRLSQAEIAHAPDKLAALDRNHDGWVTRAEAGIQ